MTTNTRLVIAGHAYRPLKAQFGRWPIPACECGEQLLNWKIDTKTAREIHRAHKKAVARENGAR